MKIVLIIGLIIIASILGVLLHENAQRLLLNQFPVEKIESSGYQSPFPLFLYIFFSPQDPLPRLEIIKVLNHLPVYFKVRGVVPDALLKDENQVRQSTGATFPLLPLSRYWQYKPFYFPTIFCVSEKGKILFVQPVLPATIESFKSFILIFYQDISASLLKEIK